MYHQHPSKFDSNNRLYSNLLQKHQEELKTKRYLQKVYFVFIASFIFISIYLTSNAPPGIPTSKLLLALTIFWVCLFPGLYYLKDPNRPPIPFLALVGVFYAVTFSLPIFLSDEADIFGMVTLN